MLITNPRTCSNLLVRILALDKQPSTKHTSYHFLGPIMGLANHSFVDRSPATWTEEDKDAIRAPYTAGIAALEEDVKPDNDTKICFTKEHAATITEPTHICKWVHRMEDAGTAPLQWDVPGYPSGRSSGNHSIFPDSYLESWTPIFLIRNPVRAFESSIKSMLDIYDDGTSAFTQGATETSKHDLVRSFCNLEFSRGLYEFYTSRGHAPPLVIDADDIVMHTYAVTQKLAHHIGFDSSVLQYTWEEASQEERAAKDVALRRMLSSLDESAGITVDPSKLSSSAGSPADLMPRWRELFGEVGANELRDDVENAMPDYEWLYQRRLMP
jgi:hypothetical protein